MEFSRQDGYGKNSQANIRNALVHYNQSHAEEPRIERNMRTVLFRAGVSRTSFQEIPRWLFHLKLRFEIPNAVVNIHFMQVLHAGNVRDPLQGIPRHPIHALMRQHFQQQPILLPDEEMQHFQAEPVQPHPAIMRLHLELREALEGYLDIQQREFIELFRNRENNYARQQNDLRRDQFHLFSGSGDCPPLLPENLVTAQSNSRPRKRLRRTGPRISTMDSDYFLEIGINFGQKKTDVSIPSHDLDDFEFEHDYDIYLKHSEEDSDAEEFYM